MSATFQHHSHTAPIVTLTMPEPDSALTITDAAASKIHEFRPE